FLLVLRAGALESGLFKQVSASADVAKGSLRLLFSERSRTIRFLGTVVIGLPIWYVVGVLIAQSDTIATAVGVRGDVKVGDSIMWSYVGLSVGDLLSGALSQWLRSRRKVIFIYLIVLATVVATYLLRTDVSLAWFHFMCFALGAGTGFWALFVTVASEQFGTNLRSTVTNLAPNLIRGCTIPLTLGFTALIPHLGVVGAGLLVGGVSLALSWMGVRLVHETFHKEMDYVER
ncbi:MAG TPA: MFS transporter, partial [Flavobacteriales bacterium]|nr:MFS transporter [Flavobacteriales bacterium]